MWLFFLNILNTVSILWHNTHQIIPVGDDLTPYKNKPYAELYIDNRLKKDSAMYYEYEYGHTFFSVVNTKVVGVYTVKYQVVFPTYGFSSVESILFEVKDLTPPVIDGPETIEVDVGQKNIDYLSLFTITDNYNSQKELSITVNSHLVNTSILGSYPVEIKVLDASKNQTTRQLMVKVVDRIPPSITPKKMIELNLGEALDLSKYFTFKDNYDEVLRYTLDDKEVNYQRVGSYDATLMVIDQSDNKTSLLITIKIQDISAPIIKLKVPNISINYKEELTIDRLRSYVQSVTDNHDILSIEQIIIKNQVDSHILGTYDVVYEVYDHEGNMSSTTLIVYVKDLEDPKVELKSEIIVDVLTYEPNYFDYLIITDNYNQYSDLTVDIKSNEVKVQTVGTYWIYVTVKDVAKNEAQYQFMVQVVDRIPPTIELPIEITITDFKRPNYDSIIKSNDNYSKTITISVNDEHINYQKVGYYEVEITALDSSGNVTTKPLHVSIIDVYTPVIKLQTNLIKYPINSNRPNYYSYIKEVYDVYDPLTIDDVSIIDTVNYDVIGLYEVIYILKDPQGHETKVTLFVDVADFNHPVLTVKNATINQGEVFDPYQYASAYDDYDGDISNQIKIKPQSIPTHVPGIYEVIYYVRDSSGNYTQEKAYLTIISQSHINDYILYGLGVIGGLVLIVSYTIYRRRHPKIM